MSKTWRRMKNAHRDGRHIILRLRKTDDMSAFEDVKRWAGGVLARWHVEDDNWRVLSNPADFANGTVTSCDSHWFTGWKRLPDRLFEPEAEPA